MEEPLGTEERDAGMQQGGGADWSQLPPELLPLIYKALPDSADFVRFRAVCMAWRESAPVSDPPPQLPWVLERRGYAFQARQEMRFYSPSTGRTYSVRGRGGRSWIRVSGAGHGYVVTTLDLSTTALYNPLTGERLALPTAPYPPWSNGVVHVVVDGEGRRLVVNTCLETRHFGYCHPGETKWNLVNGREDMGHHAYRGGRFFINTAAGDTLVIDTSTGAVESVVPPPRRAETGGFAFARADNLVESCGKLFRVVQVPRDGYAAASAEDYYFNVYQLDVRYGNPAWTKVESVGDRVLFFDEHGHGFSLSPNKSAGLRQDCVYFVHERRTWIEAGEYRFLGRYSMEDGAVDRVVSLPDTFGATWVVPTLCRYC